MTTKLDTSENCDSCLCLSCKSDSSCNPCISCKSTPTTKCSKHTVKRSTKLMSKEVFCNLLRDKMSLVTSADDCRELWDNEIATSILMHEVSIKAESWSNPFLSKFVK